MSFFENTRKPTGFGGKLMVSLMNVGHRALSGWGLRFLTLSPDAKVLDCGCGGGDEKWTQRVSGMRIYKDTQLKAALEQAGFRDVQVHKHKRGWLCVLARK